MTPIWISNIAVLVVTIGAHLFWRPFLARRRWFAGTAAAVLVALLSYYTALQYFTWLSGGSISRLLLPPYQSLSYFAFYTLTEFWAGYLVSAAIGYLAFFFIKRAAAKHDALFYPEEATLCFISLLLVGHPFWIFHLVILLICLLIGTLFRAIITKNPERVSPRYLWLPIAIITLALSPLLTKLDFVIYLKF